MIVEPGGRDAERRLESKALVSLTLQMTEGTHLETHSKESQDRGITRLIQSRNGSIQPLCQTREQVQGDDKERSIGICELSRVLLIVLKVDEGLLDDAYTSFEYYLSVRNESLPNCNHD